MSASLAGRGGAAVETGGNGLAMHRGKGKKRRASRQEEAPLFPESFGRRLSLSWRREGFRSLSKFVRKVLLALAEERPIVPPERKERAQPKRAGAATSS